MSASVALIVFALAGCADQAQLPRTADISKAGWQNETNVGIWPFTVNAGVLTCYGPDRVTFTASGTEYALSDDARWLGGYPSVSPILAKGYVEIGDQRQPVPTSFESVTERGRQLCS